MLGVRDTLLARSQPLATARLTIAPSALGDRAGITGPAAMVADVIFGSTAGRRHDHLRCSCLPGVVLTAVLRGDPSGRPYAGLLDVCARKRTVSPFEALSREWH
jgi:hypothetical protein